MIDNNIHVETLQRYGGLKEVIIGLGSGEYDLGDNGHRRDNWTDDDDSCGSRDEIRDHSSDRQESDLINFS